MLVHIHRWLTLPALVALVMGSSLEPIYGMLRDGTVHHESEASALSHQTSTQVEHGHEDPGLAAGEDHPHGSRHQHGTGSDHCTHAHGIPLPSSVTPSLGTWVTSPLYQALSELTPRDLTPHAPPPKA